MQKISVELKEKMLKNAEIILSRDLDIDGLLDCSGIQIKCPECPLSSLFFDNANCRVSKRSYGKVFLQNWYNENKPKENKMNELQIIDTSKWQWILVSDTGNLWTKKICFGIMFGRYVCLDDTDVDLFLKNKIKITSGNVNGWNYAKYIEQRNNSALDVMWWGGVTKVCKFANEGTIYPISFLNNLYGVDDVLFNELHLVDGHAEIKHKKWLTADELEIN